MPPFQLFHRPPRLAFVLALLAVLAQLWMVQLGTRHLAQQAGLQAFWGEICSVHGSPASGASGASEEGRHGEAPFNAASCPVCSAAAASFMPPAASTPLPALWVHALQYRGPAEHTAPTPRRTGLRPPAQAPPAA